MEHFSGFPCFLVSYWVLSISCSAKDQSMGMGVKLNMYSVLVTIPSKVPSQGHPLSFSLSTLIPLVLHATIPRELYYLCGSLISYTHLEYCAFVTPSDSPNNSCSLLYWSKALFVTEEQGCMPTGYLGNLQRSGRACPRRNTLCLPSFPVQPLSLASFMPCTHV
jgi:hypothetical protein